MNALCVILEMHLMLQGHLTDFSLDLNPFVVKQMLPLEVFRQVPWTRN